MSSTSFNLTNSAPSASFHRMSNKPPSQDSITTKPAMMELYDIALSPPAAPNPWKARLALNFKGVPHTTKFVPIPDIPRVRRDELRVPPCRKLADGSDYYTLPVLIDEATATKLGDTVDIAIHLHTKLPPSAGAGELMPEVKRFDFDWDYAPEAWVPPLSEREDAGGPFAEYSRFNYSVDAAFSDHVGLMGHTMPFDPAHEEACKAEFMRRAGVSSWDLFEVKGALRDQMIALFHKMLGRLAKVFEEDTTGPFALGRQPCYADIIVGAWLRMMHACLPKHELDAAMDVNGGVFRRLHEALEPFAAVK